MSLALWRSARVTDESRLELLKRDRLDLTAGKLGKEELDGREIGSLVLVHPGA
jgi:hypothetical protein